MPDDKIATETSMKKFFLLVVLAVLVLGFQHSPAVAQNAINGVIARVTQNGVQLKNGMTYRWAEDVRTTLANGEGGGWTDLQADDAVRLTMNRQNLVSSLEVIGRDTGQRVERSLTEIKPVEGHWDVEKKITVAGRVFEAAGIMNVRASGGEAGMRRIVFSTPEGFDALEVWVGFRGGYGKGKNKFVIQGDGRTLFTSPWMAEGEQPVKANVSIKGYTGISLISSGDEDTYVDTAVWANPMLVKIPPSKPIILPESIGDIPSPVPNVVLPPSATSPYARWLSPPMNSRINRDTPLVWQQVDGASGYLLELQAVTLFNPADANHQSRFLTFPFPANMTAYTFNVNRMPKGAWRWRVHALSDTGFLSETNSWAMFTSQ